MERDLATIAHKLRTPLTVIMSTVNNLLDGAFGPVNEAQTKWLKKLGAHTNSLEILINDILDGLRNDGPASVPATPSAPQPVVPLGQAPAAIAKSAPARILIVDDEPDILDTIEEGLRMEGFHTLKASNGSDAIALALQEKPDLILMDVLLKDQNGLEVCQSIKAQLKSFTPVLLITGQEDLRQKVSGARHEADDLLTKPFQMAELFIRVSSMLRIKKLNDEVERLRARQPRENS
jgi:CheY-like chemotaxis protein